MKTAVLLIVLPLLHAVLTESVKVLDSSNFDSVVGTLPSFVEFYAPWCGHCKALAPEYEQVGEVFSKYSSQVTVAKVDCDSEKDLCSQHGVKGYPTLQWFPQGQKTDGEKYEGGRTADDIVSFINSKTGLKAHIKKPASEVVVLGNENFDKVVLAEGVNVFVEFYAPWCGHCKRLAPDWEKLGLIFANEPKCRVAKLDADKHNELAMKYDITGFPTLKFFSADDKTPQAYDGGRSLEELVAFLNEKCGTKRNADGSLSKEVGRLPAFDELVAKVHSSPNQQLVDEAESLAQTFTGPDARNAKIYTVILKRVQADSSYVAKEKERINKLLQSDSLVSTKREEFLVRLNILAAFEQ